MRTLPLLAAGLAFGAVHCGGASSDDPSSSPADLSDGQGAHKADRWMSALSNDLRLSELSVPGTHESCARHEPLAGTAMCQTLSIDDQLAAGVRYFDIRCRHFLDHFTIHHGPIYQELSFDDVLRSVDGFLAAHSSETVVLSVKEEFTPLLTTQTFEKTFGAYVQKNPSVWYLDPEVPRLETVRGKVVLLRRFPATHDLGIDANPWADEATFSVDNAAHLRVQDNYKVVDNASKWSAITSLFHEARSGSPDTLFLNYTSGYRPLLLDVPNVPDVANEINARLNTYLESAPKGRTGVVAMDFVDTTRAKLIFEKNFQ
jgi:1-phosphatidylinositol phosphodiesterase